MTALLAIDSITKSFGARQVLTSASIWAHPGRITALFGRNGCGKSTLLRIGCGLVEADQGVVHFAGEVHLRPRLHRLASSGLFLLPDRGLFARTVTLRRHFDAIAARFGDSLPDPVLKELNIEELMDVPVEDLSGGETRRAEIAAAVIRKPRCLLADEPFLGISPADAELVGTVLRRLADDGCALIVTGHEVRQLMQIADDIVWMVAGTTHHLGPPDGAVNHEQFRRDYLGAFI